MAQDNANATDGVQVDRDATVESDHLTNLDQEIKDAERRVKDATKHLDQLNKQKQERSR